ncbi:hypothetical protein HNR40_002740 [Nonomuraea endophytica]|uniref:Uncharacterized protein n=1 Tax=Nonomuraea endophytica TaxID=714136 RepID=A0A7W8A0H8_9ACTN|nr:hypothetical protein [Nonomuraea endophytica]
MISSIAGHALSGDARLAEEPEPLIDLRMHRGVAEVT